MNERRRPPRRGRGPRPGTPLTADQAGEDNPYREGPADTAAPPPAVESVPRVSDSPPAGGDTMAAPVAAPMPSVPAASEPAFGGAAPAAPPQPRGPRDQRGPREPRGPHEQNGRRGRRNRGRGRQQGGGGGGGGDRPQQQQQQQQQQ